MTSVKRWLCRVMVVTVAWNFTLNADTLRLRNGTTVSGSFLGGDAREVRFAVGVNVEHYSVYDIQEIVFEDIDSSHPPSPAPPQRWPTAAPTEQLAPPPPVPAQALREQISEPLPLKNCLANKADFEQCAVNAVLYEVTKATTHLPIQLDATAAFAPVAPPVDFQPVEISCSVSNRNMPLPPGDYTCEIVAYCMRHSAGAPRVGMAYTFGPLQGQEAETIVTLLNRGAETGIDTHTLQVISWSLQAAITPEKMPPRLQQVVHQLIPEREGELNHDGDFLKQIFSAYKKAQLMARTTSYVPFLRTHPLPPLESILNQNAAGREALQINRTRETIQQSHFNYEQLSQQFYARTVSFAPQTSPWTEIRPGVLGQFVVEKGYSNTNRLNFRVLPTAAPQASIRYRAVRFMHASFSPQVGSLAAPLAGTITLGEIFGLTAVISAIAAASNPRIAYAINQAVQALLMAMTGGSSGNPKPPCPNLPPNLDADNSWGNPSSLFDHFVDHGADFGATDAQDYVRKAHQFLKDAPSKGYLTKFDPRNGGTIRVYDPKTNTFGSYNADGTTKSFFKPDPSNRQGNLSNRQYWEQQKGNECSW